VLDETFEPLAGQGLDDYLRKQSEAN
jgi:hypothetical protein